MKLIFGRSLRVQEALDELWSGVWWLALRRWLQERRLTTALEETGEYSMITRCTVERYRVLERSMKFWRASPPLVLDALEASQRAGVPVYDLKLLALNREARAIDGTVKVQRSLWSTLIAPIANGVVLLIWIQLSALVVLAPSPWPGKLISFALFSVLFWCFWRGFTLYTTRPNAAIKRSGEAVESIAMNLHRTSAVVHLVDFQKT